MMRDRAIQAFVKYDDWRHRRRDLNADEEGLSLVAYALGAAFIVVPLAIALFIFGQDATTKAADDLDALLAASTPSL